MRHLRLERHRLSDGANARGGDGGQATAATLNGPIAIAHDASGNTYIADFNSHRVRRVSPAGVITAWAGTGVASGAGARTGRV